MLKKAILLVSGSAFGSLLQLLRNLIVARLVSPENYGIASTLAISMSIVEMLSYLGLNLLMVVDKDGDNPHFQAAMHGFQALRGVFSCAALYVIARPYASFLGIEQVTWAYQMMALVPLINGLQHYDPHRLRRKMIFLPTTLANSVPPLISVLSVWPATLIYGDYRIMLVALFVQAFTMVILSHVTAERWYRITLDIELMRKATKFGWPLLLNGILLFGVFNGERLIVARELGIGQFAFFSMAFTLTLTPTLVLASSCQSLFLPQLSTARENPVVFQRTAITTMETSLVIALLLILGTSLIGGPLSHLLTGPKYLAILPILVPMAVLQALRVAKTGSGVVALAIGQTGNSAVGSLVRVASLPVSWWVAIKTGDVLSIIWIGCVAEVIGYVLSMYLAAHRAKIRLGSLLVPTCLTALTCAVALFDALYYPPMPDFLDHMHAFQLLVAAVGLVTFFSMGELRRYVFQRFRPR